MDQESNKSIILFDGECMICNSFIKIPLSKAYDKFIFVSNHSEIGKKIILSNSLNTTKDKETIYLLTSHSIHSKSNAVKHILSNCGLYYKLISLLFNLVPLILRDSAYEFIAKNRRMFNKKKCEIPKNIEHAKIYY